MPSDKLTNNQNFKCPVSIRSPKQPKLMISLNPHFITAKASISHRDNKNFYKQNHGYMKTKTYENSSIDRADIGN